VEFQQLELLANKNANGLLQQTNLTSSSAAVAAAAAAAS